MNFRLKPLRFTYVILLGVFLFGCATVDYTKQKPPLFVDYNYSLNEVYLETFNVLTSQAMAFEEGGLDDKFLLFRYWDMGIPIIAVQVNFIEKGKNKTSLEIRYNPDGALPTYNLRTKIESILRAINDRIMLSRKEEYPQPYHIRNLEKWLEHYNPQERLN